jgi:hypothetical protein
VYVVLFSTPVCLGTRFSHTHAQTYLFVPLSLVNFIPPRNNFSSRETTIEQQSSRRTTTRTLDRERRRRREVLKRACRKRLDLDSLFPYWSFSLSLSISRARKTDSKHGRAPDTEDIVVTLSVVVVVVLQQIVKKCGNWSARNQIWMPRRNCTR